jgi:trans-aconitate methyltransferase
MTAPDPSPRAAFDAFAKSYDSALDQGLSATGESRVFFAHGRIRYLARCLGRLGLPTTMAVVMDYGCGAGESLPLLKTVLDADRVVGVDVSGEEIKLAKGKGLGPWASFSRVADYSPQGDMDLVYCNGTFHHIPPLDRPGVLQNLHRTLKPGGLLALWENNPWNPGTRYVMSRIPFDQDAIPLSIRETRRLVRAASFEILRSDFLFLFPRFLAALRSLEPWLSKVPAGGQYQVLGRKV